MAAKLCLQNKHKLVGIFIGRHPGYIDLIVYYRFSVCQSSDGKPGKKPEKGMRLKMPLAFQEW